MKSQPEFHGLTANSKWQEYNPWTGYICAIFIIATWNHHFIIMKSQEKHFSFQAEFMAIELENGFVVFKYYLGQGSFGRIQSALKYNRNQWVSVAAARSGLLGRDMCN